MVTVADVARYAGVSEATATLVFNEPDVINANTRERVQVAAGQLGYQWGASVPLVADQSSKSIGVVINNFSSMYYGSLLDGIERAINAKGFKMLAESTHARAKGEIDAWTSLLERECDAVIIHSDLLEDDALGQLMKAHPMAVLMNRFLPELKERCIHLDNRSGGALAAQYLYDKGHRQIAMITGPADRHETRSRSSGFIEKLQYFNLEPLIVESTFLEPGGYDAMVKLLDLGAPFTGVFAQNDQIAAGVLLACREAGFDVPQDVSIIGFDDIPTSRHLVPRLTTVRQPLSDIGAAAGRLAHALVTGVADTSHIPRLFEPELVERDSVLDLNSRT